MMEGLLQNINMRHKSWGSFLALTLEAAKDLHQENCKALITFEPPQYSSFKSNAQAKTMLRIERYWLVD